MLRPLEATKASVMTHSAIDFSGVLMYAHTRNEYRYTLPHPKFRNRNHCWHLAYSNSTPKMTIPTIRR